MSGGSGDVYRVLKKDITHFLFKPGDRLVEEELSERYGVSRTPIREALRRLEEEGLVTGKASGGRFVPHFDVNEYEDLYIVRMALEQVAVAQACDRATKEEVRKLRTSWAAGFEEEARRLDGGFVSADERFHLGVARLSKNAYLIEIIERINDRLRIIRMVDFTARPRIQATRTQHNAILGTIEAGDARGAQNLMRQHIEESKGNIRDLISRALTRIYLGEPQDGKEQ